jgi:homoserine dehydrogenase
VVILGRLIGLDLSLETLSIENIVPEALRHVSLAEFESRLPEFDAEFAELNSRANLDNKVLRYVGLVGGSKSSVRLQAFEKSHPFASLQGSDNVIRIVTERFPNGLTIQGAGAGADVTAFGIFSDVLKIGRCL